MLKLRTGALWLAAIILAVGALPSDGEAQGRIGAQGVYQSELFGGAFGVGGRGQLDLEFLVPGMSLMGTYDHYFPPDCDEGCSLWEATGSLLLSGGPGFYFGAGAGYQQFDRPQDLESSEDWIVNFVVGLLIPGTSFITPFIDARFEAFSETTNQVVFSAGVFLGPEPSTPGRRR